MQQRDLDAILPLLGAHAWRLVLAEPPADAEVVPAEAYLTAETMRKALLAFMAAKGTTELQAAASVWNKQYNGALLAGLLAAMTLAGVGLDASIGNVSVVHRGGLPKAIMLHDLSGTVVYPPRLKAPLPSPAVTLAAFQEHVFTKAIEGHLTQIIDQIYRLTRTPKAMLWGNVGNLCASIYYQMERRPEAAAAIREDRAALLEQPDTLLYNPVRYEELGAPDLPPVVLVRRTCCQKHKLPESRHCTTCPLLSREERIGLIRQVGPE